MSTILEDFLIRLGFTVDDAQQKKFERHADGATKAITSIAGAAKDVAVRVATMVDDFAGRMEQLYFVSKIAHSSAVNLDAMGKGAERAGVSAQRMQDIIAGVAIKLQQPGLAAFFAGRFNLNLEGKEPAEQVKEIIRALSEMDPKLSYLRNTYGAMLGIGPAELELFRAFRKEIDEAEFKRKQSLKDAGVDLDSVTKQAHEYANAWRDVGLQWDVLGQKFSQVFLPIGTWLGRMVNGVLKEFSEHSQRVQDAAFEKFYGYSPKTAKTVGQKSDAGGLSRWLPQVGGGSNTPSEDKSVSMNVRTNNPGNIIWGDWARKRGAIGFQKDAAGIEVAVFPSPAHGLRAMADLTLSKIEGGLNTARAFAKNWRGTHPTDPQDDAKLQRYSAALAKSVGSEKLDTSAATVGNVMGGVLRQEIRGGVPSFYGEEAIAAAVQAALGAAKPTTLNQQTTINLTAPTSREGNRLLIGELERVNQKLARQMGGKQ